jgi:hypothetical protein
VTRAEGAGSDDLYGADGTGTLVTIYPVTAETVLQSNLTMEEEKVLELDTAPCLPAVGSPAWLVIEVPRPAVPAGGGADASPGGGEDKGR